MSFLQNLRLKLYHFKKNLEKQKELKSISNKQKIFCIGRNKTGTTSLEHEFLQRGFVVGNQFDGENLLDSYINKDFTPIIDFCKTAQVFQDAPFSYPETYKYLDQAFPDSKFILSVRNSSEEWYNSLINHHSRSFGKGKIPSKEDLQNAKHVHLGWMWKANRAIFSSPENEPYHKESLIADYQKHNDDVIEYFKNTNKLLIINLSKSEDYINFCQFLNLEPTGIHFAKLNQSKDKIIK